MRRSTALLAGVFLIGARLTALAPASAQALGDADCPGGYYYDQRYALCVLNGMVLAPDAGYAADAIPPLYSFYGPPYVVVQPPPRRDDRDHRQPYPDTTRH